MINYARKNKLTFNSSSELMNRIRNNLRPSKPVICENTGQEFSSLKNAAEWFGIHKAHVCLSCRNHVDRLNYKGLAFDYKPML